MILAIPAATLYCGFDRDQSFNQQEFCCRSSWRHLISPDKPMKQGLRISLHVQVQIHGLNIWLLLVLESKKITVFEESKCHAVIIPDVRTEIDDLQLDQNTS